MKKSNENSATFPFQIMNLQRKADVSLNFPVLLELGNSLGCSDRGVAVSGVTEAYSGKKRRAGTKKAPARVCRYIF